MYMTTTGGALYIGGERAAQVVRSSYPYDGVGNV
jgi:hypothetical protein